MATILEKAREIKAEKDSKIIPANIRLGINAFGVAGSLVELQGETKDVTPSTSVQTITPSSGKNAITEVTVEAVTSAIDNNIQASNIKDGVSILGVTGNVVELSGETKNVTPSTVAQTITPSTGKNGITQVNVEAVTSAIDNNIQASNIKNGIQILGVNGTLVELQGETKNVTPTTSSQVITPSTGKNGITEINVGAVTSAIDSNIQASNIKSGVTILGVQGTVQEGITPTGTISITQNGTVDVTNYASANVNVPTGGGSGDIKQFATVAEMQADPNPAEGDLACVYEASISNYDGTSGISKVIFPTTVVLASAYQGHVFANLSGNTVQMDFDLDSRGFFADTMGDDSIQIEYTSSDGITYTLQNHNEAYEVDFGEELHFEDMGGGFDSNFGYFLQVSNIYFGGLYKYQTNAYVLAPTQLNASASEVYSGKEAYSNNGIISGTLGTGTPATTLNDAPANLYIKFMFDYLDFIPIVITSASEIPNDIVFVSNNKNGQPFYDTSNLTSFSSLFFKKDKLKYFDANLNSTGITNMSRMFRNCSNLTSLDVSSFNTSNVTVMNDMFSGCSSLTSLNLSNFNTSNVTVMDYMFSGCSSLTSLDISSFNFSGVSGHNNIFNGVPANCTIYVKDSATQTLLTSWDNTHTYTIK